MLLPILSVLLGSSVAIGKEDPCPTTPPFGYRVEVGYGNSKNQAEALAAARDQARSLLLTKACDGVSELRCASLQRHIHPWADGRFEKKAKSACAAVAVKADVLTSWERDVQQLSADLQGLADTVIARAGASLALDIPRWPSGCVAGDVGPNLAAELRNRLARHDDLRLYPPGRLDAPTVRITLAPGRDALTVSADLRRPDEESESPLGGFTVPADLFAVSANEMGTCRGLGAIGLDGIDRVGEGGLRLALEVPTVDGRVCEGQPLEPRVRVDRPAKVKVWSVAKDGSAFLVWPPPGEVGLVQDELALGENRVVLPPDHMGDEMLIAAAVAADASFGPLEGSTGFCKLRTPFGASLVPGGAAIASGTYHVLGSGEGGCADVPIEARASLLRALAAAPLCP